MVISGQYYLAYFVYTFQDILMAPAVDEEYTKLSFSSTFHIIQVFIPL